MDMLAILEDDEEVKELTLEPLAPSRVNPHDTVFINELKLSEFKQILAHGNVTSEISGGVLWCSNNTIAIRRVSYFKASRTNIII